MSDGNERHQIDPEKDAGHHNLGYQNDEEKKIGIKDLEEDLRKEKHNVDDQDNEQGILRYIFEITQFTEKRLNVSITY